MRRLLAPMLALTLVLAACGDDDAEDDAATTTSGSETTGPGETTESTEPSDAVPAPLVLASSEGVVVVSGDDATQVSTTPAAAAYAIETDLVAFQGADPQSAAYPPDAAGPVRVWADGEVRDLPTDASARRVELLDARPVDGVPTALVSERFGGANPEDTFEELVQIDLREDTRTMIVRRPAWESAHSAARILPGGDVIGLFHSEALSLLARWSTGEDEALWTIELGADARLDLASRDETVAVAVIETSFDPAHDEAPVLTVTTHDVETGTASAPEQVVVDDPDGTIESGLFCRDWLSPSALACGRSGAPPVAIDIDSGSFQELPGEPGAIATIVRSA